MDDSMIGKKFPNAMLEVSSGGKVAVPGAFQGKWTVLYLYPKDDTPGCTKQACSYRDNIGQFRKVGVEVYGLSADDLASHGAFQEKYQLNFPLLSDPGKILIEALGSYGEQEWQGKKFKGISRDTFLIDPRGVIRDVWRKVRPETTTQETYASALKLMEKS